MKTFFALSIFFAVVFNCQAERYGMEVKVNHDGTTPILGRITGDLISQNKTLHFDFGPKFHVFGVQIIDYYFEFPNSVELIKLSWKTASKMSLGLEPITISLDNYGLNINADIYVPEKAKIFNGETVTFQKK